MYINPRCLTHDQLTNYSNKAILFFLWMYTDMHDQMDKLNKAFMKAFVDQDAEAIGPMYTEDCKVMPTGHDVIVGRKGT